ncbi:MAG TPA: ABC transporter substrate-binding protein [Methylomirabilota bacterium]|nr:ABC transporter substrate-binding protein [Methylomirabilota bacterium]
MGAHAASSARIGRRKFLTAAAGAAAITAFPDFFSRRVSAAESKSLVIYNFDGFLGRVFKEQVIDPFAQQFGVKVDTITMQGSSPPMAKVKALIDAGKPEADVMPLQLTDYVFAVRNNLVMKIGRDEIPEYANLYPQFITDHGPGLTLWCYGIGYNTKLIKERPTSWRDLWNPTFKGKVALNEALFEQTLQMVNLAYTGKLLPVTDETFAHLTALRPSLVSLWATGAQAEQLMRTGEAWISPIWNSRTFAVRDQGAPVDFVIPREGLFVRYNPYTIPRGARNPELAKQYINFLCNEARQKALADKASQGSP